MNRSFSAKSLVFQLRAHTNQNTCTLSSNRAIPICVITNTHKSEFLFMAYCVLFTFYISHSPDFLFLLIHDIALRFISRYLQWMPISWEELENRMSQPNLATVMTLVWTDWEESQQPKAVLPIQIWMRHLRNTIHNVCGTPHYWPSLAISLFTFHVITSYGVQQTLQNSFMQTQKWHCEVLV